MKISEAISLLNKLKEKHGDIPIVKCSQFRPTYIEFNAWYDENKEPDNLKYLKRVYHICGYRSNSLLLSVMPW